MKEPQSQIYEFDNFRIDAEKRLLLKGVGEVVSLMPKAFDTLLYLVRHRGKVIEKDELLSAIWSDTIVEENNLTQNISILRRVFGEKPGENRFIATVPGKGYKFVPDVREIEIDDEKDEEPSVEEQSFELETDQNQSPASANQVPINHKQPIASKKKSHLWLFASVVFAVLAFSSLVFYLWRENTKSVSNATIKTVAVMPFKPLVAENRNETLELGMTESLISKLSGSEQIIVRPLSAVRRYNSLEQDSLNAGRELSVEAVLDGNIQTLDDRIRVSARLLRTSDGKQLWAGQFDEEVNDIFAVQDSISKRAAEALKIRLGNREKKHYTENVEAYQLYMKGRLHASRLTRAETDKAIVYFQQAIALEPKYALAYAGLAETYHPMVLTSGLPSWELMPKAKEAALKAIEIDETLAEGHAMLGRTIFWYDWDWKAAEKHYLRALELEPNNSNLRFSYAHLLSNIGRHEKALVEAKRARELDPLNLVINAAEGQFLFFAGKTDEALDRLNKTIDLDSKLWLSHLFISRVYTEKGMHAEAVAAAKKAGELSGNTQSDAFRAYALAKWGKPEEARVILNNLLKLSSEEYVPPYNIAVVYHGLGESEKALDYLEKGFAEKDVRMVFLKVEPKWNNLRNEPRFVSLLRRMNFE
jgi:DNA-binding winged helix-turn-helix (wHTH) protein/TolB-like protein/Flp pilus assembly protein TadD